MGGGCVRGEGVHLLLDPALIEDDLLAEVVDGGTEGNGLEGFLPRHLLLLLDLPVVVVEGLEDVSAFDGGRSLAFWQGQGRGGVLMQPDGQTTTYFLLELCVQRVGKDQFRLDTPMIPSPYFSIPTALSSPGLDQSLLVLHLIPHGISEYGDQDGRECLPCAKLGGFDVGVGEVGDEDGGDLVIAQVDVVLEGEFGLLQGTHLVLNYIYCRGERGKEGIRMIQRKEEAEEGWIDWFYLTVQDEIQMAWRI